MKITSLRPRSFLLAFVMTAAGLCGGAPIGEAADAPRARIPVILDTDIGDDIDDTWALGLALKSPELDVKLVVGDYGKPDYRARLIAKFMERAGRTDIAVGVGLDNGVKGVGGQAGWIKGYDLKSYPGKIHSDGVQALVDTIMKSERPMTLLCIGPLPNIAEALRREPRIAERARFVGMHGSVRVGYGGSAKIAAEWNVKADPKSCQKVFTAPWEMTITPLDTCGLIHLTGEKYRKVRDSKAPVAAAIIENYRLWADARKKQDRPSEAESRSSTLFDAVAVYLAFAEKLCAMETTGLRVTDDGFTRIELGAKQIRFAARWKDMSAFEDLLVERLTKP
jgi:inosine-uridine nucleoside N-ribohydrolase